MDSERNNPAWIKSFKEATKNIKKIKCGGCGSIKFLEYHHIDGNHKNNNIKNITVLCRSCHIKQHQLIFKEERRRIVEEALKSIEADRQINRNS